MPFAGGLGDGVHQKCGTLASKQVSNMAMGKGLYFDAKDYEILKVVNRFLERDDFVPLNAAPHLLHSALHPHGIKELAVSQEVRIAYAVINLLDTLEIGLVAERIKALRTLHDEVLYAGSSSFRYNTGRVLIQLMKSLVRAHGHHDEQLRLAHDFRKAAGGNRRIIRSLLQRYHLLEMPETWNQVTFDNHVHDAHTKGRKSSTHLIMDAWIKGIRKLDVVYYNYIESNAIEELLQAADIMDIKVRIGIEFQARYRDRYVQFIWQPRGFYDYQEMLTFFQEKPTQHLMRMGQEASLFHHQYVMRLLERYNTTMRFEMGDELGFLPDLIQEDEFKTVVGIGQTSKVHLAELIFRKIFQGYKSYLEQEQNTETHKDKERLKNHAQIVAQIHKLNQDTILSEWLSSSKNPDITLPIYTNDEQSIPEILRLMPTTLIDWLTSIRMPCNVILNLCNLTAEDVLELLYECQGMITHLELFNLKNYLDGKMNDIKNISELQLAINDGSAVALKKIINNIIKNLEQSEDPTAEQRGLVCKNILRNLQTLKGYYAAKPLHAYIGSDSTSRSSKMHGMGFVLPSTLPHTAQKKIFLPNSSRQNIPITIEAISRKTYYPKRYLALGTTLTNFVRNNLGFKTFAFRKEEDWQISPQSVYYSEKGNIYTLGGFQPPPKIEAGLKKKEDPKNSIGHLNTTLLNTIKVLIGFSVTAFTFAHTQSWWFLAWFGPLIWFAITGFRNIVQATLAGGGLKGSPLLRWNDYISWSRLADSLLYTGFSVPLLEFGVRWFFLGQVLGINSVSNPTLFFTIISMVNGIYIASHNIFRGLPRAAAFGNIFRSFFAIPLSMLYSFFAMQIFIFLTWTSPEDLLILQQGAAVLSKLASDTVAALLEGFVDKVGYLRMRYWDYHGKVKQLLNNYARLEVLLPEEDVLDMLLRPKDYLPNTNDRTISEVEELEKTIVINTLDLLYFWMYQPRARDTFPKILEALTPEERHIVVNCQLVLTRVQKISQLFVNGLVGGNFARPLAFYLDKYEQYLKDVSKIHCASLKLEKDQNEA